MKKLYYAIRWIIEFFMNLNLFLLRRSDKPKVVLMLTPQYLNYGDHAIAAAERKVLRQKFGKKNVLEINFNFYELWPKRAEKLIMPNDTIVITGGGYMGDLWPHLQKLVDRIINTFPNNKIVVAPQTIYFEKENSGELESFRNRLKKHGNIFVWAREENTYQMLIEQMGLLAEKECGLFPDMVLFLSDDDIGQVAREPEVGLCIREDKERILTLDEIQELKGLLHSCRLVISKMQMTVDHVEVPVWLSGWAVKKKLKQYAGKQLIITDRLHGMIFAAITGTPCIAFDNVSKKVSGVYRWIADLDYVVVVKNMEEFKQVLIKQSKWDYNDCRKKLQAFQKQLADKYDHGEMI